MPAAKKLNRYAQIIEKVFFDHHKKGTKEVRFERQEFEAAAAKLKIDLPKNVGDVIYSFRYRYPLPDSIAATAPKGLTWVIEGGGRAKYAFRAVKLAAVVPAQGLAETKIPDATPGLIEMYALSDEQSLLAILRYNRLIDVFTGVACYSLQNHLRTTVPDLGQVETDEVYIGVDRRGAHYVLPVQAKGGSDQSSTVQIAQDFALCQHKFPDLICLPIAAQFMEDDLIALFSFELQRGRPSILAERHYRLVASEDLDEVDLRTYAQRPLD
jgi:hypothetical protein